MTFNIITIVNPLFTETLFLSLFYLLIVVSIGPLIYNIHRNVNKFFTQLFFRDQLEDSINIKCTIVRTLFRDTL